MEQAAAAIASALVQVKRHEIDSDRLEWPLSQTNGVPGLPEGIAVMPANRSYASALTTRCGSGKTFTVRRDAGPILREKLVIVTTCNRLFTTATVSDWVVLYGDEDVYCYLDGLGQGQEVKAQKQRLRKMCERAQGVIFISIESILALRDILDPKKVGLLLLEETCELASKMLGQTCPTVPPFRLLRDIAREAERILYTDADFEADGTTDGRCLRLHKYLCPSMPLHIFSLSRNVEHTKRSASLYFDHASANAGSDADAWWAQLRAFLKKWQRTGDPTRGNRVACALPTKDMVKRVCELAKQLGLPWCDYTSETKHNKLQERWVLPRPHFRLLEQQWRWWQRIQTFLPKQPTMCESRWHSMITQVLLNSIKGRYAACSPRRRLCTHSHERLNVLRATFGAPSPSFAHSMLSPTNKKINIPYTFLRM